MRVIFVEQSYSQPKTENIYITSLGVNDSLSGLFFFNGGIHRNMYSNLKNMTFYHSILYIYKYISISIYLINQRAFLSSGWQYHNLSLLGSLLACVFSISLLVLAQ